MKALGSPQGDDPAVRGGIMQHYEVSIRDQVVDGVLLDPHCPNCGTDLEHTGAGADELWECPHCGLATFG